MNKKIRTFPICIASFLVGSVIASWWIELVAKADQFDSNSIAAIKNERIDPATLEFGDPPLFDPTIDYASKLKVKLLQVGYFHSNEVPYNSGEEWLGLFRVERRYELRWSTIKVRRIGNAELFDREISTSDSPKAIFLLRGADDLQTGPIVTVFDDIDGEGFLDFGSGKSFGLRGSFWWLSTEKADKNGFPQKGTSLVLKQTGYDPQVLRSLPDGCNDCAWRLLWVGDLNNDQSLDFLIDVSDHYNAYEPTLFVSTPGYGYSVYASFRGVGC